MIYFVDIDNTICKTQGMNYAEAVPDHGRIATINALKDKGHEVVYWTARGVGSGIDYTDLTMAQLEQWNCKFDRLSFDKPIYDVVIDDKAKWPFTKGRVAVVCGAPYIQDSYLGKEIDSADIVVRVNLNYQLVRDHSAHVGSRTDVVYLCGSMYRTQKHYTFPRGAVVEKVKMNIEGAKGRGYVANTGVRAAIDYALRGYEVYMYGMDFYSSSNGGVVPQKPVLKRNGTPIRVKANKAYAKGYKGSRDYTLSLRHIGGVNDVRLLLSYMNKHPIIPDTHMETIINKYRKP